MNSVNHMLDVFSACAEVVPFRRRSAKPFRRILRVRGGSSARAVENSEEGIISDLKRAVRNHGDDLDRIVVRMIYGTLLWERRQ